MTASMGLDAEPGGRDFEEFFVAHARGVAAVVALATGDVALAEEATQEAMARAARRWDRVSRLDRPDLWVVRVAGRVAIDGWRRRRREVRMAVEEPASAPDAIDTLWVRWGLRQLSPEDRLLLILRHRDGLSVDEVAARVGLTRATAGQYLKRARRRLRGLLAGDRM